MKVRFIGETSPLFLTHNDVYEVISIEDGPGESKWYRVVLEDDDDDGSGTPGYLYSAEAFEIVKE